WHVVGGPREFRDLVLAAAGRPDRLWLHFQEDELREAAVPQTPRRRQSGDAAAHNDDRNGHGLGWWSKGGAVTESMAQRPGVVDERARDRPPNLAATENGNACCCGAARQKPPARDIHRAWRAGKRLQREKHPSLSGRTS